MPIAKVTPLDAPFVNVPKVAITQRNPRCTADIAGIDPLAEIAEALLERCEGKLKQIGYVPCRGHVLNLWENLRLSTSHVCTQCAQMRWG